MKINDIVEIQCSRCPTWNGIQFRVHSFNEKICKGEFVKIPPALKDKYSVGAPVEVTARGGKVSPLSELVVVKKAEMKEPISRNGTRLFKGDVVRVLKCCNCKGCAPFKGSLATITATQDEDEWLRSYLNGTRWRGDTGSPDKEPILRLKMDKSRTSCCFRACNVDFVSRAGGNNHVYIDHIYERVTQNATPGEILILINRLSAYCENGG